MHTPRLYLPTRLLIRQSLNPPNYSITSEARRDRLSKGLSQECNFSVALVVNWQRKQFSRKHIWIWETVCIKRYLRSAESTLSRAIYRIESTVWILTQTWHYQLGYMFVLRRISHQIQQANDTSPHAEYNRKEIENTKIRHLEMAEPLLGILILSD